LLLMAVAQLDEACQAKVLRYGMIATCIFLYLAFDARCTQFLGEDGKMSIIINQSVNLIVSCIAVYVFGPSKPKSS
jgi:hypothetical protein